MAEGAYRGVEALARLFAQIASNARLELFRATIL